MTKGTISYYSRDGQFLFSRKYYSKRERTEFMQYVGKLYGRQYQNLFYQINPYLSKMELKRITLNEHSQAA